MKTTTIESESVRKMRWLATELARFPAASPENNGWKKSPVDPMALLAAFPRLRLKPGIVLRAYVFQAGENGNGVVWAVPANLPFPDPFTAHFEAAQAPRVPFGWPRLLGEPHVIPGCLPDLMTALLGDGSPESYFEASVFEREAGEFGARWHGCDWSTHRILGNDSWTTQAGESPSSKIPSLDSWTWSAAPLENWDPTVSEDGDVVTVRFVTFTGLHMETLSLHVDTYRRGSYERQYNTGILATGRRGYIF